MSADQDIGLDEKRVYDGDERVTRVYVASDAGVVAVSVVGDRVGEFGLVERATARDVATGSAGIAVASPDGVLLDAGGGFEAVGFEDPIAVSVCGADVIAANADGAIARYRDGDWTTVGSLSGVNAVDGDLAASDDGIYRVREDGLRHVGLASASDVAAGGVPLAVTSDGLFKLGNGWLELVDDDFAFVTADPGAEAGLLGRAHAGTEGALYAHHDGEWAVETTLERPAVDVAYGDAVYAVSEDGRFVAEAPDDWRSRDLGVRGVTAAAARHEEP